MEQKNKINKRILTLSASSTLLIAPVLLTVGCNYEINRYSAALPNSWQNRIPFDFAGVSLKNNINSIFKDSFSKENIEKIIKPQIEGIMAQEAFVSFFVEKLGYAKEKAISLFSEVSNSLGNKELMNTYLTAVNNGENFDNQVYNANLLIFQTDNWHQMGTIEFDYSKIKDYQNENDPNLIFNFNYLNEKLNDPKRDEQIKKVATYADDHDVISELTSEDKTWGNPTPQDQLPAPLLREEKEADYQKKIERFQWWLRFRYQEYYQAKILPQINRTLFTMTNILNSILKITTTNGTPKVEISNSKFANQLQDWGTNATWNSKYYLTWNYTTDKQRASSIDSDWGTKENQLPNLIKEGKLDNEFFNLLANSDEKLKNTLDPIFNANSFMVNTEGKVYDDAVKNHKNTISDWLINNDGTHYWGQPNINKGTFIYLAPVYWIDVVQNLDFNFKNDSENNPIVIDTDQDPSGLITAWHNSENSNTSNSEFSKYIRGQSITGQAIDEYKYQQEKKWSILWQMLYSLASQNEQNSSKSITQENYLNAAKIFYPLYIPKNKIYSIEFWEAVKSHY